MLARMPEVDNLHRSRKVFGGQPPNPESSIPHDHYLARLGQTIHDRQRIERLAKVLGFAASGYIVLKWVAFACTTDKLFARLCDAMGRPELASSSLYGEHRRRLEARHDVNDIVANWAGALTRDEI